LSRRTVIASIGEWRDEARVKGEDPKPAAAFVEAPVYRRQAGLWEHQKYFVKLAFDTHLHNAGGARFVLADQVGLGKTVQLAMAAQLMALVGDKPVLVLAPKTLLWQWQDELLELLDMPSAVWTGTRWLARTKWNIRPSARKGSGTARAVSASCRPRAPSSVVGTRSCSRHSPSNA